MPPCHRPIPLVLAVVAAASLAACSDVDPPEQPEPSPGVARPWPDSDLDLEIDVARGKGDSSLSFDVDPPTAVVTVVTSGGGALREYPGPTDDEVAALFPGSGPASHGRLAVLRVEPGPDSDLFSPDSDEFQFGLDLTLPDESARTATDDGDNLVQRGLFGDVGQIKLQVDGGVPSCRIAGDRGDVTVKAGSSLTPGQWYRLRCQREAQRVTLYVGTLDPEGEVTAWEHWTEPGTTGDVEFEKPFPAISVGGKLNPRGGVVPDAPDQFSGALTHVTYARR